MKRKQYVIVTVVAIGVLLIISGGQMFFMIKPGERAVIFRKFSSGLDKDNIYKPGRHVVAPWNDLIIYDVTEQKIKQTMDVLDKEGQSLNVEVTIIFNPFDDMIGYLHENIGANYVSVMVIPNVRSSVRAVTGRYNAEEIYSIKREEVEAEIITLTRNTLAEKNIEMKDMLIQFNHR
jgi:regulator of protease activity HflC (stomatin/prohibitin superfamily)